MARKQSVPQYFNLKIYYNHCMFSGIIQESGTVKDLKTRNEILEITISSKDLNLKVGSSIAVDGCCLTVVELASQGFTVQVTQETLRKTNFQNLKSGSKVNLEPSLKLGDSLDGHLVSGHIDASGEVSKIIQDGENTVVKISYPRELRNFIAQKGSIAVNGVSLTVIESKNNVFSFTLIPFTRDNTNLGLLKEGDLVNLEVDLISRYLINYMENTNAIRA